MFDSPQVHHRQILSVGTQMSLLTVMSELESVSLLLCNLVLKADGQNRHTNKSTEKVLLDSHNRCKQPACLLSRH